MQIQRGLRKDSSLTKFVLGAHPIIEHFINLLRIRETIGTYVRGDKRMRLDDDKTLAIESTKARDAPKKAAPARLPGNRFIRSPLVWTKTR